MGREDQSDRIVFARRLHWDLTPNTLSQRVAARRASGERLIDLTNSNPTRAGFDFAPDLLAALADRRSLTYEPTAQGLLATRQAVAAYYAGHGAVVDPDDIFLTASTSEAYSYVFKLLADPGDEILVPQPSYPLFDFLAGMESLKVHPYPAQAEDVTPWRVTQTRALVAVHPNNPTGDAASRRLASSCAGQGLPLIVDEVFLDYNWNERTQLASFVSETAGTVFVLSGLSKVCGLPQMKLGWIVVAGRTPGVKERLELVADTYLSASAPVQWAAVQWLAGRHGIQEQIRRRCRENLAALDSSGLRRHAGVGGWTAVVELAEGLDEERLVLDLLEQDGVLVQPGYFYDFPRGAAVVVSLLALPEEFASAIGRLKART